MHASALGSGLCVFLQSRGVSGDVTDSSPHLLLYQTLFRFWRKKKKDKEGDPPANKKRKVEEEVTCTTNACHLACVHLMCIVLCLLTSLYTYGHTLILQKCKAIVMTSRWYLSASPIRAADMCTSTVSQYVCLSIHLPTCLP